MMNIGNFFSFAPNMGSYRSTVVPDVPNVPDVPDVPNVSDVPVFPDVSDVSDVPDVPDVSDVPDVPVALALFPQPHCFPAD